MTRASNQVLVFLEVYGQEPSEICSPSRSSAEWIWVLQNILVESCSDFGLKKTVSQHRRWTWQPKSWLALKVSLWTSSKWIMLFTSLPLIPWTLTPKWKTDFPFIRKQDLGPLAKSPALLLPGPVETFPPLAQTQKWLDPRNLTVVAYHLF